MEDNRNENINAEIMDDASLDEVTGGTQILGASTLMYKKGSTPATGSKTVATSKDRNMTATKTLYKTASGGVATDHGSTGKEFKIGQC